MGLPVAVAFGKTHSVVGFDIKQARIAELKAGRGSTSGVTSEDLVQANIRYTDQIDDLNACVFL